MKSISKNRILEIDALRGIAAIFVVFFHYSICNTPFFRIGGTGVDLFFIISGFVIMLTINKTPNWKDFVVNRFSRLYPTYWICLIITSIVCSLGQFKVNPFHFVVNLTMIQSYFGVPNIDGSYWTLLIELFFYLLMIVISISKLLPKIELIGTVILVLLYILNSHFIEINYPKYNRSIFELIPLFEYFPLFFSGIIFYKLKYNGQKHSRYILLVLCLIIQVIMFSDTIRPTFFLLKYEYTIMLFIWFTLFLFYVNNLLRILVNKFTLFLGNISFSLYLIHQQIGLNIIMPYLRNNLALPLMLCFLFSLIIICLLAFLIMKFVEKPSMNFIRNKYKQYKQLKASV